MPIIPNTFINQTVIFLKRTFLLSLLMAFHTHTWAQTTPTLISELASLKTNLALVVNSSAVEERALWSPQSDYLACRIMGKWMKIPLTNVELKEGKWQGRKVGLLKNPALLHELSESDLQLYRAASEIQPVRIRTTNGTTYSLKPEGNGMALVATQADGKSQQLWSSGGEACHSMSLSPDQKYLVCICEPSGLLLTKLE